MSICRCERHDVVWDSDWVYCCPMCLEDNYSDYWEGVSSIAAKKAPAKKSMPKKSGRGC